MQKVRIIGLQSQREKVVKELHRLGVIDVRKSRLELADDVPADTLPAISELIVRYHSALVILDRYSRKDKTSASPEKERQPGVREVIRKARALREVGEILALEEKRTNLEDEIAKIKDVIDTASLFVGSGIDFSKLKSETLEFGAYLVGGGEWRRIKRELHPLSERYEIIDNKIRGGHVLFVAKKKEDSGFLEGLETARKIDIATPYLDSTAEKSLEKLTQLRDKMTKEREAAVAELDWQARVSHGKLAAMLEMLEINAERASVSISFKRTQETFVVEGWVVAKRVEEIRWRMRDVTNDKFLLDEIEADELAPTLISRRKFFEPFDYLMEFFSLPRSDELDPTLFFLISFPVFYGLMVSDVGYGIASLLFATLLARISQPEDLLYNVARVWQISSIAVVFFGFITNQYFGFGLNQYFTSFAGFNWIKAPASILAITVVFGIVQVAVGLGLGFFNNYRQGRRRLAVSKLTAVVALVSGAVAVSGGLFGAFGTFSTEVAAVLAAISALMTVALSGSESVEMISVVSHPLSYARIMGFGLASVVLAFLIDKAFTPSLSNGALSFSLMLIAFILLHFVNMILGIFEGVVQGVRLNFVEFFSKFYTGGGIKFRPFFHRRRYTKEV